MSGSALFENLTRRVGFGMTMGIAAGLGGSALLEALANRFRKHGRKIGALAFQISLQLAYIHQQLAGFRCVLILDKSDTAQRCSHPLLRLCRFLLRRLKCRDAQFKFFESAHSAGFLELVSSRYRPGSSRSTVTVHRVAA